MVRGVPVVLVQSANRIVVQVVAAMVAVLPVSPSPTLVQMMVVLEVTIRHLLVEVLAVPVGQQAQQVLTEL
jgi:hypothetical protein